MIGEDGLKKLAQARVAVFGLGGVGGAVVWALARAGIGNIRLIDCDEVAESNLNRQMVATFETVGMRKVEAAAKMVSSFSTCALDLRDARAEAHNIPHLCAGMNFVVDAIDDCDAKEALAVHCVRMGIPILSSMGTGNKLSAAGFAIADLAKTSVDPLARVMRRRLRKHSIAHLPVCVSQEVPQDVSPDQDGRRTPASISFVPPSAGLVIASEVVKRLLAPAAQGEEE